MRGTRRTRDEACRAIVEHLDAHAGESFTAGTLASLLGIGQGRTRGLLPALADEGRIAMDGKRARSSNGHISLPLPPRVSGCADYIRFFATASLLFPGAKVRIEWPRKEDTNGDELPGR
jgi:hypothetical protein